MRREKSKKKTYAQPRMDEMNDENNSTEEMERVQKKLDGWGLTIVKTEDGKYSLVKKEEK